MVAMQKASASHTPVLRATFQVTDTNVILDQDIKARLNRQAMHLRPVGAVCRFPHGRDSGVCLVASQWAAACCGTTPRSPQSCLASVIIADSGALLGKPELGRLSPKLLWCLQPAAERCPPAFPMQGAASLHVCSRSPCRLALSAPLHELM